MLEFDQQFRKTENKLGQFQKQIDCYVYDFKSGHLGKGSYGTVYKGYNNKTNQEVAIKLIKKKPSKDEKQLFQEINLLKQLNCPNIIKIYDVFQTQNNYYIILEYCNLGDLDKMIHLLFDDHFTFLIDTLSAFISLIKKGILHRDLKPANILIHNQQRKIFKLGDFGFARQLSNYKNKMLSSKVGTPLYMSPQLLEDQEYTSKSDIWSLALIYYQILYNRTPWVGRTQSELLANIKSRPLIFPSYPEVPEEAKDFIIRCLQPNEKDRISWDQLYRHPYVVNQFSSYVLEKKLIENKAVYLLTSLKQKIGQMNLEPLFYQMSGEKFLTVEKFSELMWKIDKDLTADEIQYLLNEIDSDGNGRIDFDEFKKALEIEQVIARNVTSKLSQKVTNILMKISMIIKKYNVNLYHLYMKYSKNDVLDLEQLSLLLKKIDPSITVQEMELTLKVFDVNGDCEIQFSEFKQVFDEINNQMEEDSNKYQISNEETMIKIRYNPIKTTQNYFENQSFELLKIEEEKENTNYIENQNGISIIPMKFIQQKK